MKLTLKLLAIVGLLGGLSACEEPTADQLNSRGIFTVPITSDFEVGGIRWQDDRANYTYVFKLLPLDGQFYLCGVGAMEGDRSFMSLNRRALAKHSFRVNGTEVARGTQHFNEVLNIDDIVQSPAYCKATGASVPEGNYNVEVEVLKSKFVI